METIYDVIVAGAGPAGSSCARAAAASGLSVLVLEKDTFPRLKPCAGGLTSGVDPELLAEIEPVVHDRVTVVEVDFGPGSTLVWEGGGTIVRTTIREELDALLAELAASAGARIEYGLRVELIEPDNEGVSVVAGGSSWRGRHLVGADGVEGTVRRRWRRARLACGGAIYVRAYPDASGRLEPYRGRILFDLRTRRQGYGWVFPKRDHLNVGVYGRPSTGRRLKDELRSLLESLGLSSWRIDGPFAFPVAARTDARDVASGRILLVGDAAGLTDPITGEGIPHAIASGRAAAESIVASLESSDPAAPLYARRVAREILPRINALRRAGSLYYALGPRVTGTIARSRIARRLVGGRRVNGGSAGNGGRVVVRDAPSHRRQ